MRKSMLKDIYTALITPFKKDYTVDYETLKKLLIRQDKSKIDGIVLLSTTGESATIKKEEATNIIMLSKKYFSRDIIIGIAENAVDKVREKMQMYDSYEPQGYLICSPFYNKGNAEGLYEFYKSILEFTKFPIIIYNVPSRCCYDIPLNVIKKLAKNKNIIGIKNASYSYKYYNELAKIQNDNFKVLCGNDDYFLVGLSLTGSGIISVATNIIPNYFVDLFNSFKNNYQKFKNDYFALESLFSFLSLDINPIMIKEIMSYYQGIEKICRIPLKDTLHGKGKKMLLDLEKNERIKYECYNCR